MGTWSHEPFGNDDANDWAYALEEAKNLSLVEFTLDKILEQADQYLEAPEAQEAVAAIEVLARLLGRGSQFDTYTEKIDAWVKSINQKPSAGLLQKAQRVIVRILAEDSELFELWQEGEDFQEWHTSILQLKAAVSPDTMT